MDKNWTGQIIPLAAGQDDQWNPMSMWVAGHSLEES